MAEVCTGVNQLRAETVVRKAGLDVQWYPSFGLYHHYPVEHRVRVSD